jgi:hypothetical protein
VLKAPNLLGETAELSENRHLTICYSPPGVQMTPKSKGRIGYGSGAQLWGSTGGQNLPLLNRSRATETMTSARLSRRKVFLRSN